MRGLIILCISTWAIAAPQEYMYSFDQQQQHYNLMPEYDIDIEQPESSNTIQELPEIQQNQQFSVDLPLEKLFVEPATQEKVPLPFTTYGFLPPAPQQHFQNEIVISKQFFLHSAPEEEDEEIPEKILTIGKPRRNYNVVFIRAPVKQQKPASIKLIPAANEDKTIVYVLSKKTEAANIDAHVESLPATTTKPEVYFIKYKTPEEASHAQEKIQAEYERLGGSTQVSNESISPVNSVIGSLDKNKTVHDQPVQVTTSPVTPSEDASSEELVAHTADNAYLPPN